MAFDFDQAMPFASNTLYGRLRADSGGAWDAYVHHRFVRELAAGTLARDEFLAWMVQDYLYLIHYARAYALLIFKSGTVAKMRSAATIVFGLLNNEMSLHRQELREAGVAVDELDHAPESIETLAYGRYILDRAQAGDELDLIVTLSACLAGYGEIGLRVLGDPETRLDGNPYRSWIETYAGAEYHHLVREGLAQLEEVSESHGGPARYPLLLKQFRQAVLLEAAFWDAGRSALAGGIGGPATEGGSS
jgi:thiaminase/transcriptional activator TenA